MVKLKTLQIKYNLKQQWRMITEKKKPGSGLAFTERTEWLIFIKTINVLTQLIHHSYYSKMKKKTLRKKNWIQIGYKFNDEGFEQEAPPNKTPLKKKIVTKLHKKWSVPCSQLQALSELDAGVNKLAEVNAKRMKLEQEDRKALLKFWPEEAAKYRDHKKEMIQLYFCMITQHAILHNVFHPQYSAHHIPERFN